MQIGQNVRFDRGQPRCPNAPVLGSGSGLRGRAQRQRHEVVHVGGHQLPSLEHDERVFPVEHLQIAEQQLQRLRSRRQDQASHVREIANQRLDQPAPEAQAPALARSIC